MTEIIVPKTKPQQLGGTHKSQMLFLPPVDFILSTLRTMQPQGGQNKPQRYHHIEDRSYGEPIFQEGCVHTGNLNQGRLPHMKSSTMWWLQRGNWKTRMVWTMDPTKPLIQARAASCWRSFWVHDHSIVEGSTDSVEAVIGHNSQQDTLRGAQPQSNIQAGSQPV